MDSVSKPIFSTPSSRPVDSKLTSSFVRDAALILFGTARTLPEAIVCRLLQGTANGAIGVVSSRDETRESGERRDGADFVRALVVCRPEER